MTAMKSLSQREFRNQSAEVLRSVAAGESFLLTNNGLQVGKIVPLSATDSELRVTRPAKAKGGFSALPRHRREESTEAALTDLRGER